jgi:PAS domain S-box-containing protein
MTERKAKKCFSNVSKKTSAERRLKQTLKMMKSIQSIVDSCPAVVFQRKASEGWPVEYISESVKQFGYSDKEFMSGQRLWSEIVHPDDVRRLKVKLKKYIKDNIYEFIQEYRLFSSSGNLRWIEERTKTVINSKGKTTHYRGIILDVTERKIRDAAVRKKAKKEVRSNDRTILNATNDAMFLIDKDGTLLAFNKALSNRLSKDAEELLGMCVYNLLPPDLTMLRKKWIEHVIESGKPIRFEDKRDGVWLENFIYPIFIKNASAAMFAIFSRDITAHKHYEQDRENLIERLQDYISKIKTLSGLIPICSSCKRVRGDDGYWGQLEVYISEHSDAEFSHGLCPECAKKIYPDY